MPCALVRNQRCTFCHAAVACLLHIHRVSDDLDFRAIFDIVLVVADVGAVRLGIIGLGVVNLDVGAVVEAAACREVAEATLAGAVDGIDVRHSRSSESGRLGREDVVCFERQALRLDIEVNLQRKLERSATRDGALQIFFLAHEGRYTKLLRS